MCVNLYRKIKIYGVVGNGYKEKVDNLKTSVQELDSRGIFEKDDDVGFVYDDISNQ